MLQDEFVSNAGPKAEVSVPRILLSSVEELASSVEVQCSQISPERLRFRLSSWPKSIECTTVYVAGSERN